jgi:hypothetical protein
VLALDAGSVRAAAVVLDAPAVEPQRCPSPLLELGAAPAEHLHAGAVSQPPRPRDQRGLADAGWVLDDEQPPGPQDG